MLPEGSVVTSSDLSFHQEECTVYNENVKLCLYEIDSSKLDWDRTTLRWNNLPLSQDINGPQTDGIMMIDYTLYINIKSE